MGRKIENEQFLHSLQTPEMKHLRDLTIYASEESFLAHRVVLASSSPILAKKLASTTEELKLLNVSGSTWRTVQNYIYNGQLIYDKHQENLDAIKKVMECAQDLQMEALVNVIETTLIEKLNTTNCCIFLQLAHRYTLKHLKHQAMLCVRSRYVNKPSLVQRRRDATNNILLFVLFIFMLTILFGIPTTSISS